MQPRPPLPAAPPSPLPPPRPAPTRAVQSVAQFPSRASGLCPVCTEWPNPSRKGEGPLEDTLVCRIAARAFPRFCDCVGLAPLIAHGDIRPTGSVLGLAPARPPPSCTGTRGTGAGRKNAEQLCGPRVGALPPISWSLPAYRSPPHSPGYVTTAISGGGCRAWRRTGGPTPPGLPQDPPPSFSGSPYFDRTAVWFVVAIPLSLSFERATQVRCHTRTLSLDTVRCAGRTTAQHKPFAPPPSFKIPPSGAKTQHSCLSQRTQLSLFFLALT